MRTKHSLLKADDVSTVIPRQCVFYSKQESGQINDEEVAGSVPRSDCQNQHYRGQRLEARTDDTAVTQISQIYHESRRSVLNNRPVLKIILRVLNRVLYFIYKMMCLANLFL